MSEKNPLRILTTPYKEHLELGNNIKKNKYLYTKGDFTRHDMHSNGSLVSRPDIDVTAIMNLKPVKENGKIKENLSDKKNCKIIYDTLKDLTPAEASNGNLWSRLCHYECIDYIKTRHPIKGDEDNYYKEKFNAVNPASIRENNPIGRLWWVGHFLCDDEVKKDYTFKEALDIFFISTDMLSRVYGSFVIMSYPKLAAGVLRLMDRRKNFLTDKPKKTIAGKTHQLKYRRFFVEMNSRMNAFNVHRFNKVELDDYLDNIYKEA